MSAIHLRSRQVSAVKQLLAPVLAGHNLGLLSDAGCPAVADPGARLVEAAHRVGVRVVPLVGPSSILLALMGSGLNGQKFAFHGYLPIDAAQKSKEIKRLEKLMLDHARSLEFEKAARVRDELALLKQRAFGAAGADHPG